MSPVLRVSPALRVSSVLRVSIVGSTDMPGRSRPISGSFGSMVILTGTRCTILVKLPVALSGGSSANSWPLAGAMLFTTPCTMVPGKVSTSSVTGWPAMHVGELRLLVVGADIDCPQRHHRHQLRAGLHVLPDPQAAGADSAIGRRRDRGIAHVQFSLVQRRPAARPASPAPRPVVCTSTSTCLRAPATAAISWSSIACFSRMSEDAFCALWIVPAPFFDSVT